MIKKLLNPIIVSWIAICISVFSVWFSIRNANTNRIMHLNNIRGEIVTQLTIVGLELLSNIKSLLKYSNPDLDTIEILKELAEDIVKIRNNFKLEAFGSPSLKVIDKYAKDLSAIKIDWDDSIHIFEKLTQAVNAKDMESVKQCTKGLHERFHGTKTP
ncbi:MAG: hypothetical protein P9X22_00590 [Candidatus Zapsychrus exili]|nr:hypothetical protein [Candidatus Zapsychrus exili]